MTDVGLWSTNSTMFKMNFASPYRSFSLGMEPIMKTASDLLSLYMTVGTQLY